VATKPVVLGMENRHMGQYTGSLMEGQTLVCYGSSAVAHVADGVVTERRQAPD
jgi:hypothetical protein